MLRINISSLVQRGGKKMFRSLSYAPNSIAANPKDDFTTLPEMATKSFQKFADRKAFGTRVGDKFEWMTYSEFGKEVQKFRNVLHHHKFGYNDKIALISNNRIEWAVAAYAAQSLGGQIVPMYEVQLEKDWRYIIEDSGSSFLLVATEKIYEKVNSYVGSVGIVRAVLCMDSPPQLLHSYQRWMKTVEGEAPVDPFPVTSSDLCTIIYTSGTTGKPKGVELTHSNLVSNMKGINKMWAGQHSQHTSLAFLPWAHVYGQTCEVFLGFARGDSMAIVGSREQIVEGIAMVKPTTLLAVPALFNRVYDGIMKKASSGSATQQKVFKAALQAARRRNHLLEFGKPVPIFLRLQYAFFDRIVFSKIRERLGGRLVCMCAGGAATTMPVLEFFEDIGIPICSGYGLTETSPVIAASTPAWSTRRLGTNGPLLEGISALFIDPVTLEEVPFGQEGELIVSGPNVMAGYHNKPEATAEVFLMKHGKKYFRTGDLGLLEDGKFLKITGRIKEQFKLENGKYVVPIPVEEAICRSAFVAQAVLYGDNKKHTVLLVVPEWAEVRSWALTTGVAGITIDSSAESLLSEMAVINLLTSEIQSASNVLKSFERPSRFDIILEPFSQENQMMTPKMSVRRQNVLRAYQDKIDGMYSAADTKGYALKIPLSSKHLVDKEE